MPVAMEASRAALCFFCLIAVVGAVVDPYENQPMLESQNGHLFIVGASGANITLKTRGGGQVNINGENVLKIVDMALSAAQKVDKWESENSVGDGDSRTALDTFLTPLTRRVELIEASIANGSSAGLLSIRTRLRLQRSVRILTGKVKKLTRDVKSLLLLVGADDCKSDPCFHAGTCQDMFNDFRCSCPENWEGKTCQKDVDECERFKGTDLGCQNGATCQNLEGAYRCICPPGWYGIHCTKLVRTCETTGNSLCGSGICVENKASPNGYICQCSQGWTLDKVTGTCTVDVDECTSKISPCSHDPVVKCENLPGSFKCDSCPGGYVGNGYQCRDVDECATSNGGCSINPLVQCINTRGSRVCGPCPPGYSGDGITCTRTDDLCQVNHGGCHPLAECIHNPGLTYVQCKCPHGYAGSGVGDGGCVKDSSTALYCPANYCRNGGTCVRDSARQALTCMCLPYFTGSRCEVQGGINACSLNPCQNNGTCISVPRGIQMFKCLCEFGFTGDKCQYSILGCGGTYRRKNGTLTWPMVNSTDPKSLSRPITCQWTISAPSQVLNITIRANISCSVDFLRIHDGRNSEYPAVKVCGYKRTINVTTTWNVVHVIFETLYSIPADSSKWPRFIMKWTSVPRVCGAEINATQHGTLSSPGWPGYYPHQLNCVWHIKTQLGKRIQFTFFSMDVESHSKCKFDHLKIFDGPEVISPELAVLCNRTTPPPVTTSSYSATLHFVTDEILTGKGWQLAYTPIEGTPGCGGILNLPYGRIVPPQSHKADDSYGQNLLCEWRIRFPGRDKVKLEFKNFKMEFSNGCSYDHLEIFDGPDTNSKLLGRWCGDAGPKTLVSSASSITVVFKTDASYNEGGFVLDYSTVCDVEYSEPNGTVSSPLYPRHYPSDRECHFLLSLPVGNAVTLQMLDLDIEQPSPSVIDDECFYDTLTIYDGDTTQSKVLATLCGNGTVSTLVSSHNYMLLVFKSDVSGEGRGFMANYSSTPINCGGIFRTDTGTIKNPTEVVPGSVCRWIISAPAGKVIELGWSSFLLGRSVVCLRDNIKIFENSTDITQAQRLGDQYCGDSAPPTMTSSSNIIMIVLTASRFHITNPRFTAFYRFVSLDESCSGNFYSTNGVIRSPKYPNEYPNGMKCTWTINVPTGRQIRLNVNDFELEGRSPCGTDYLEIRNGGYETSPLIGKYCGGEFDDQITSFGNQLHLKFVSDSSIQAKGFSLTWDGTLTGCGGEISGYSGTIISPNYPSPYGRNVVCVWRVSVSQGSAAIISIVDIDLETHSRCLLDYIEIYDGPTVKSPSLGRYCSSNHPLTIASTGNTMSVKFRSDISRQGRGFHLKFATACNMTIKGYRGVIESPLFPSTFGLPVDCMWTIQAPLGNTFSVVFSHLMITAHRMFTSLCSSSQFPRSRFATTAGICNATRNCEIASLQIDEGTSSSGRSLGQFCEARTPPVVNSTFNEIKVHLKTTSLSADVLFRLEWFVVGCGGVIKGKHSGHLSSPEYPAFLSKPVVCEWSITVDVGSSVAISIIELAIDKPNNCDRNGVQLYGGPDSGSPRITKLCKSLESDETFHMQTSGNKAFVRLQVLDNNKRFKFHAMFDEVASKCGGYFNAPNGSIHSHNFPQNYDSFDDCVYEISISENKRINLTFTDFDVDSDANCTSSYVKVYDGDVDTPVKVYTYCKNTIPTPIISTANKFTVRLNAGNKVAKGFRANYSPICGTTANVSVDEFGIISYNEYHDTDSWENCTWIIRSDALGKKFTLTFTKLEMRSSSSPRNSSTLKVLGGEELTSPVILKTNGDVMPPSIQVPAATIMVTLSVAPQSHVSFDMEYSLLSSACGGTLEADSGVFTSPGYPDNYPLNVECVWLISNSPGNSLTLQIESLDIEKFSESCNEDYLEVRSPNEGGQLIGVYCGSVVYSPRVSSNTNLWVKFRSTSGEGKGFKASYTVGIFNELSGNSGAIESPRYPALSIRKSDYRWRIQVAAGSKIELTFSEVYFHGSAGHCVDKLTLFDGFDETGSILKVLCGFGETENLDKIQSSSNVLFLVFHALTFPARFSLTWEKFAAAKKTPEIISHVNCSEEITIEKGSFVTFKSPGFPYGYTHRVKCDWVFRTDPYYHIAVSFPVVDLERSRYCTADKVDIFDATTEGSWKSLGVVCHENDTKREFEGSNSVKVTFSSDVFGNRTGISGIAYSVCGGSLTQDSGMISFNRSHIAPQDHSGQGVTYYKYLTSVSSACTWNISVKPGKRIELSFSKFNFLVPAGSSCSPTNHLVLREGFEEGSPFIGDTQYCDANKPNDTVVTSSNRLQVSISSYDHFSQEFEMSFSTKSRTCASSVQLSAKSLKSMIIRSPNYPNMPPPHAECTWQFFAPNGETIHVEFIERFDLAFSTDCAKEYVELRDGSTERSHLIGRFCYSTPPPFVLTEGNALFMKYFTDEEFPNNGFKAKVSLSKCGGTFHDTSTSSIESPGYPEAYDPNSNCVWRFISRAVSVFKLTFVKFALSRIPLTMRGICNTTANTNLDTLNITVKGPSDSASWIICGENVSLPNELKGSELIVNFTSHTPNPFIRQPTVGFKIKILAEREKLSKTNSYRCGGSLNLPSGTIESPGYPVSRGDYCSWRITAPRGRRIKFTISDFDFETRQGLFSPAVYVYSDFGYQADLATWKGSVPSGTSVSSSSNLMMITLSQYFPSSHRGFRGHYSSDLPSLCPTDGVDTVLGSRHIFFTQPFFCSWEVVSKSSNQTTTVISVVGTVDAGRWEASKCYLSKSTIEFSSDPLVPVQFCNVAEAASPSIFITPYPSVEIKTFSSTAWDSDSVNYTVSWKINKCGGVFTPEGAMTLGISSYSSNTDCVWKISYPEETTIKIKFASLDVDLTGSTLTDCSSDYLSIHNGAYFDSPHILKTCGSTLPQDIVSFSNNLWIHFHSDEAHEGKGFSLNLSPAEEGCGGIRHESTGVIESVNYPNGYPNNSNCVYEIRVNKGYHIGLTFVDRFYIENSVNCTKDFIEVYDFVESSQSWSSLGRICGRNNPKVFNSTSSKMKLQFISDGRIQGDGFRATWSINCGGVLDGSIPGVIHSPNFPRDYDADLVCNYTVIGATPSSLLFGSFAAFDVEARTTSGCYDMVEVYTIHNRVTPLADKSKKRFYPNAVYKKDGTNCGAEKPPRFVSFGSFRISFITDGFSEGKGFLLNFGPEDCGGNVTQPGIIKGPIYSNLRYNPNVNCTWRISAPVGNIIVIKIEELALATIAYCSGESLTIWDGNQPNKTNRLATVCGHLSQRFGLYRTSNGNAVVELYASSYNPYKKFSADVSFVQSCGKRIYLADGSSKEISSPDADNNGKYDPLLDCLWTFSAPDSMAISLSFTKFDVQNCSSPYNTSCSCDFVEVYDGVDENAELIGRFCGSNLPNKISSSRSFLAIKFSTDEVQEQNHSGFKAVVKPIQTPCGVRYLNATDEPQTLTSPGFPQNYPQNLHCSWVLTSNTNSKLEVVVEEVDITQSPGCLSDNLKIRDISMGFFSTRGLLRSDAGQTRVYVGNNKISSLKPSVSMGSRYPFAASIFCGKRKSVDYYSSSSMVNIKFTSNQGQTAKGFKLTYRNAGCGRNYTAPSGRILVSGLKKRCIITVTASSPNSTIALYFSEAIMYSYSWSTLAHISSFASSGIKVYDGLDIKPAALLANVNRAWRTPEPVFSNSSAVSIDMFLQRGTINMDITYTTTDRGRGCGGSIFNYGGIFTSPLYPRNIRSFANCRWDVSVPAGGVVELEFTEFDLGPKHTCGTDYVMIFDYNGDTEEETLKTTYCGGDTPAKIAGSRGALVIKYIRSIHNGGTGWVARFMSRNTDPAWPALVGQHLIA